MAKRSLTSHHAVCIWIPLFALRAEERRRPELAGRPTALLSADDVRRVWQVSPRARHEGVSPGMTVSQAIGLCPVLTLVEPDPVHYDELFSRLVLALSTISPVVEPGDEIGRVYVGVDGLEKLLGGPKEVLGAIDEVLAAAWGRGGQKEAEEGRRRWGGRKDGKTEGRKGESPSAGGEVVAEGVRRGAGGVVERVRPGKGSGVAGVRRRRAWRLGWAAGKFPAWVAATRAKPGSPVIVADGELVDFLQRQRIGALPVEPDTHRRLWQLGLRTLRDLVALPEQAVVSQFGREGRLAWRFAAGEIVEPVVGHEAPQPIVASMDFPTPIADRQILANTIGKLIDRALRRPQRIGWRVRTLCVRAALEHGSSWMIEATLKDPTASRTSLQAPLLIKLDHAPPTGAVDRLSVEFTAFVHGTKELQLFARDAEAAARTGRRRALRWAVREIKTRLSRPMLHHIIEVHPWSRIPERRYALIDYDP